MSIYFTTAVVNLFLRGLLQLKPLDLVVNKFRKLICKWVSADAVLIVRLIILVSQLVVNMQSNLINFG